MRLRPLGDRVIVKPAAPEEVSKGGVILAEQAQEEQDRGIVLMIGPGHLHESGYRTPVDVPIGSTVVYSKYAGAKVQVGGADLMILRADDLLGVEEDGAYDADH